MKLRLVALLVLLVLVPSALPLAAETLRGSVERILVHGPSLEGNLIGDSPDRHVSVYLPPSYKQNPLRRYPVVYVLHGFTDNDDKWFGREGAWLNLAKIADDDMTSGASREMILVMPDAYNGFSGSMYSSSVTVGDWESFISRDLVHYIDAHYHTLAKVESRGLAGHSMGGYGTIRIGFRHPEVFSSIYALSPCCLGLADGFSFPLSSDVQKAAGLFKSLSELQKADFNLRLILAAAASWSPDPKKAPLYLDVPAGDGPEVVSAQERWEANMPLITMDQNLIGIKHLHAIAFDAGQKDEFKHIPTTVTILDRKLNENGVAHQMELYDGTHLSRIAERLASKVLPFFSNNLNF